MLSAVFIAIIGFNSAQVIPFEYIPLPVGETVPNGWLETQLQVQAAGLTGHLSLFWPGVEDSSWIHGANGHGDNELQEFAPYWLNGIIPLHFLLPNNNDLQQQSWRYISTILNDDVGKDGWLGVDNIPGGNMYWGRWNVLNALSMYCEGNSTLCTTIKQTMLNFMLVQASRMRTTALGDTWSGARWMDFVLSVMWLLDNGGTVISGHEQDLEDVIRLSHQQGFNWEDWFQNKLPDGAVTGGMNLYTHGVNNAQAFKSAAVYYRYSKNETLRQLSINRLFKMDAYQGQATGLFGSDEHLAGRMPSRGTETCTVVEYMWSMQIMFRVFGDVRYLDRLERITMNALPATFGSPAGGDMWAHQYLQQNNEINSMFTYPHIWASDGPNATVYGLAPNYGCCTANLNQGWPKFAAAVYSTVSDGVAIGIYAPSQTKGVVNGMASINIVTNYPFQDGISININAQKAFNLYLRIPSWTNVGDVALKLDNNQPVDPKSIINGTMYKLAISSGGSHVVSLDFHPKVRLYKGYNGSVSLLRGSLLFSLPIQGQYQVVANYNFESKDYWCLPQSKWNYALIIDDLNNIDKYVQVRNANWVNGHAPFNRTDIPIMLQVNAKELYSWGTAESAAAPPPRSPACANKANCNPTVVQLTLVPHGTTDLRIAEFPLANTNY